jgi:hypothetical protein
MPYANRLGTKADTAELDRRANSDTDTVNIIFPTSPLPIKSTRQVSFEQPNTFINLLLPSPRLQSNHPAVTNQRSLRHCHYLRCLAIEDSNRCPR